MKKYISNTVAVLLLSISFVGCANLGQVQEPAKNDGNYSDVLPNVKEDSVFVRNENLATAVFMLIKKVDALEKNLVFASRDASNNMQVQTATANNLTTLQGQVRDIDTKLGMYAMELSEMKKRQNEQIVDKNNSEQNTLTTMPKIDKTAPLGFSSQGKVVEVLQKRVALFDKPSMEAKRVKYAYRGDRFYFDNLVNGFYHLTKQNAYVDEKAIEVKPSLESLKTMKKVFSKKKRPKETIVDVKAADANATSNADAYLSKETNTTTKGKMRVANSEFIKNSEIAKTVAAALAKNQSITQENVKQACTGELKKHNIDIQKNQSLIDVCVATWSMQTHKK
ncbi:MAG: hypothetical protein PHE67_00665 [Campylobacterales bacterium]|nr:hypothetical protein [Campylobacterales bacterium]